jgi:hypothetical protein
MPDVLLLWCCPVPLLWKGNRKVGVQYFMAALVIYASNVNNGGMRALLLILLIVAVMLIMAGAIIALFTFSYARKQRASLVESENASDSAR